MKSLFLLGACLLLLGPETQAAVYTTGVAINLYGANPPTISAWSQPNLGGDGAELALNISQTNTLTPTSYTVGDSHIWHLVTTGIPIDQAFTTSGNDFANSITGTLNGSIHLTNGQTFMLAFWMGPPTGPEASPSQRYGWANIQYTTQSGLVLLSSAIDDTGNGIVAGSFTSIPEPAVAITAPLFAMVASLSRPRRAQHLA